jgi:hypothetical protein
MLAKRQKRNHPFTKYPYSRITVDSRQVCELNSRDAHAANPTSRVNDDGSSKSWLLTNYYSTIRLTDIHIPLCNIQPSKRMCKKNQVLPVLPIADPSDDDVSSDWGC